MITHYLHDLHQQCAHVLCQKLGSYKYDKLTSKALQILLEHFSCKPRLLERASHAQVCCTKDL